MDGGLDLLQVGAAQVLGVVVGDVHAPLLQQGPQRGGHRALGELEQQLAQVVVGLLGQDLEELGQLGELLGGGLAQALLQGEQPLVRGQAVQDPLERGVLVPLLAPGGGGGHHLAGLAQVGPVAPGQHLLEHLAQDAAHLGLVQPELDHVAGDVDGPGPQLLRGPAHLVAHAAEVLLMGAILVGEMLDDLAPNLLGLGHDVSGQLGRCVAGARAVQGLAQHAEDGAYVLLPAAQVGVLGALVEHVDGPVLDVRRLRLPEQGHGVILLLARLLALHHAHQQIELFLVEPRQEGDDAQAVLEHAVGRALLLLAGALPHRLVVEHEAVGLHVQLDGAVLIQHLLQHPVGLAQ